MLAFRAAGIPVEEYHAYEIDKFAIKSATHNFPDIQEHGDVFKADFTQYKNIDFLIGGSPCTYWSIAQKNNRETEASGIGWELFCQYVRALKEAQPKYFVYENNKSMSEAIRQSINATFGFEAVLINSALVSAQSRQRLYWVGKRNEDGTYSKVNVEQPDDRGIVLRDIIEDNINLENVGECETIQKALPKLVDKFGYIPEKFNAYNLAEIKEKSPTLSTGSMVTSSCATTVFEKLTIPTDSNATIRVGTMPQLNGVLKDNQATRIYSINGKSVTQSAQGGGWGAKTGLYAVPVYDINNGNAYEVRNGFITIRNKQYPIKLTDGFYIIRKLTVRECMKLQTVPEDYEFPVSDAQAYKQLGNGWTIEVIKHLLESIMNQSLCCQ